MLWKGPRRGPPQGVRRGIADAFVRTLVVIPSLKGLDPVLLCAEAARDRPGRLALQVAMHPLVRAVFLRTRGMDPLMDNPELHPPDIQRGQPVNPRGGEGRSHCRCGWRWAIPPRGTGCGRPVPCLPSSPNASHGRPTDSGRSDPSSSGDDNRRRRSCGTGL